MTAPTITAGDLALVTAAILENAGASPDIARAVAEHLAEANLCGRASHGVRLLNMYIRRLKSGEVSGTATPAIANDGGAVVRVDGNRLFGQLVGDFSVDVGVERARRHGVCLVLVQNAGHMGRNARWPERAARQGVASAHFVHGFAKDASVVPFGSSEAKLRTSPIALGAPSRNGEDVILDFSVAEISGNTVRMALERNERLPTKALLDQHGQPSDDPALFASGMAALLPFGGFKGYGLAVFAQIFGGIVGGANARELGTNAMLSVYFDVARAVDPETYYSELETFLDSLRFARPQPGMPAVAVPGDRSRDYRARMERDGIPLGTVQADLVRAAGLVGTTADLRNGWPILFETGLRAG
jgi:uncharacterized oxidoreductase